MILCLHIVLCVYAAISLGTVALLTTIPNKKISHKFINAWLVLFVIAMFVAVGAVGAELGIRQSEFNKAKGQAKEVTVVPGHNDDSHTTTLYYNEDEKVWFVLENKLTFVEFTVQKTVLSDAEVNQYLPLSIECIEKLFENHSRFVIQY